MTLFQSLTVLSIEQATTLPFMTLRLAEEGMRVIRLENPPLGDPNRWVGPQVIPAAQSESGYEEGMNAYYLPNNMGKQSITLNLRADEGRTLLHQLVRDLPVDIFATNQRPRSFEKLGIDYQTLKGIKPDLIWVSITGFGPQSNEAAYDPILQARSGFMELTGEQDGDPMVFGLPMVDLGAGEHAYGQVMKALYRRSITREGSRSDISMFQSAVSWTNAPFMLSHSFDVPISRRGNTHQFFAPVSVYPTADGNVYFAVGNDRQWEAITRLPDFKPLARVAYERNAGRIENVDRLNQEISLITGKLPTETIVSDFNAIGVPISPVNRLSYVREDPFVSSKMVYARDTRSGKEIALPPPPVVSDYLRQVNMTMSFPPRMGEHNELIYGALGHEVSELRAKGVI
jgi:formyl-CoA transferase